MPNIPAPDLSSRPFALTVTRSIGASPETIFRAWTERLDDWLAAKRTVQMTARVDSVFYFETHHGDFRATYYGRFLNVDFNRRLEFTWVSIGTNGFETIVSIELVVEGSDTQLRLTHAGFATEQLKDEHEQGWQAVLNVLDQNLRNMQNEGS